MTSELVTEDHVAWARAMARQTARGDDGLYEELLSAALFGLTQAAASWRSDRGASFRTHAYARMHGAMIDELRQRDHLSRHRRKQVQGGLIEDPGPPVEFDDAHAQALIEPSTPLEDLERADAVRQALDALPGREQFALWLRFQHDCTLGEIGEVLGVTESRVSQIVTRALQRLRARLEPTFAT